MEDENDFDDDQGPKSLSEIEVNATCLYGSNSGNAYSSAKDSAGNKLLEYTLHKIICQLSNNKIVGVQFFYKNRTDGSVQKLIDIQPPRTLNNIIEQDFELSTFELVINFTTWMKDVKLIGFEIETSKGRTKKFGYGNTEEEKRIVPDLENRDRAVVGFGFYSDDKEGITGIDGLFLSKKEYSIILYSGFLHLRHRMKDESYRKRIEEKVKNMPKKLQILYRTCNLPANSFFEIMKYSLS